MAASPFNTLIPHEAALKRIIDRYGPLPEEVPCGLQNCRTKNGRGFVVAFIVDGIEQIGAIGRYCGRNHFGTDWLEQQKVFVQQENTRALQVRLQTFLPDADSIIADMADKLNELRDLREKQQQLATKAPSFFSRCVRVIKDDDGRIGPDFQMKGRAFFTSQAPMTAANILKGDIERVQEHVQRAKLSTERLALKASEIGNIYNRWEAITDWITAAQTALKAQHMAHLVARLGNADEIRISLNLKWILVMEDYPYEIGTWTKLMQIDPSLSSR